MRRYEELSAELDDRRKQLDALPPDAPERAELQAAADVLESQCEEALPNAEIIARWGWNFHDVYKAEHAITWETALREVPFSPAGYVAPPHAVQPDGSINFDALIKFECMRDEVTRAHVHLAFVPSLNVILFCDVPPQFWEGKLDTPNLS